MDQQVLQLLQTTPFLNQGDREFLIKYLPYINSQDKTRLVQGLQSQNPAYIIQILQYLKAKIYQQFNTPQPQSIPTDVTSAAPNTPAPNLQNPTPPTTNPTNTQDSQPDKQKAGIIDQLANLFHKDRPPEIISPSILSQPQLLGTAAIQPMHPEPVQPLQKLEMFNHPAQLGMLSSNHISFGMDQSGEQAVQNFLEATSDIFSQIPDINIRRAYFMNFLRSQLFSSYISSAVTAMKHPELQPRKIVLNTLNQANPQFLNNKQVSTTALISNHLRNLCGL
jgi:hypothetical protein